MNGTISPIQTPEQVLAEASSEALLDSVVRLTHAIHGVTSPVRKDQLRVQRGLVRAELLRRIAGVR